ncbi:excalibur calcium-binding domain-containing protein [Actinoplanes sp. NPDC051859]|uniref:excalibur calcium-binding domain-containing protein n=1 Tax=Actinoplanes sp. NPDC051859 TaxID=3363909 RepID=UPI00378B2EBD
MSYPLPPRPPGHPLTKRRKTNKIILGVAGAIVALCCGGTAIIAAFTDPPESSLSAAPTAATSTAPTKGLLGAIPAVTVAPATPSSSPTTISPAPKTPTSTKSATRKPSTAPAQATVRPKPTTKRPKPQPTPTRDQPESVYYKNCDAVRAAGKAPIRRGDPGYGRHLDRDGDGQGCGSD